MRKLCVLVLALALVLLVVSCKQEINCKISTPSWARGNWSASGTMVVSGEGSYSFTGSFYVTSENISGTTNISGYTSSFDWRADLAGKKDYIKDFSQNTTSTEYSFNVTFKDGNDTLREVVTITKGVSQLKYTEFVYLNGATIASTTATLLPL